MRNPKSSQYFEYFTMLFSLSSVHKQCVCRQVFGNRFSKDSLKCPNLHVAKREENEKL
jgi:hypothetical protein